MSPRAPNGGANDWRGISGSKEPGVDAARRAARTCVAIKHSHATCQANAAFHSNDQAEGCTQHCILPTSPSALRLRHQRRNVVIFFA